MKKKKAETAAGVVSVITTEPVQPKPKQIAPPPSPISDVDMAMVPSQPRPVVAFDQAKDTKALVSAGGGFAIPGLENFITGITSSKGEAHLLSLRYVVKAGDLAYQNIKAEKLTSRQAELFENYTLAIPRLPDSANKKTYLWLSQKKRSWMKSRKYKTKLMPIEESAEALDFKVYRYIENKIAELFGYPLSSENPK